MGITPEPTNKQLNITKSIRLEIQTNDIPLNELWCGLSPFGGVRAAGLRGLAITNNSIGNAIPIN